MDCNNIYSKKILNLLRMYLPGQVIPNDLYRTCLEILPDKTINAQYASEELNNADIESIRQECLKYLTNHETMQWVNPNKPIQSMEQKAVDTQEQRKRREERKKAWLRERVNDKKLERQNRQNELDTIVLEDMDIICEALPERYKLLRRELRKEQFEIRLLKKCIDECYTEEKENEKEWQRTPTEILAEAVMSLGRFRVRRRLIHGWLCGTYCSNVRRGIQGKIEMFLDETDMERLICYCGEEEADEDDFCEDMLLVLQWIIPNLYVNPRPRKLRDYLD